jgi:hypothetical protein
MLAIASIGKLKMVIDFPLPVTAPEPSKCGRNLCIATLMAINSALSARQVAASGERRRAGQRGT